MSDLPPQLRKAVSDIEATPPVNGNFTLDNLPSAGQSIRERLRLWQQQMESPVAQIDPFTRINQPQTTYNNLQQGADDIQLIEGAEDDEGVSNLDNDNDMKFLRPGDVVGLQYVYSGKVAITRCLFFAHRQGVDTILSVFVRRFNEQEQYYTMSGSWIHTCDKNPTFVVEHIIQPEELQIIIPYLPQQEIPLNKLHQMHLVDTIVPREAGAKVIRKLLHFHNSSNDIVRDYASRLNNIHEIVAHPTKRSHVSLHDIAMKVLKKDSREALTASMLWAVHSALKRNDYCESSSFNHRGRPRFDIMSRADAISTETVRDWARDYQERVVSHNTGIQEIAHTQHLRNANPIPGFIEKSRALIHESRKTRDVTHSFSIGPSRVRIEPTEPDWAVWKSSLSTRFDEDESKIIWFLFAWSLVAIKLKSSGLRSIGPTILRAIGMYENFMLGKPTGMLLLAELGIIPPWLNRVHYMPFLPLPSNQVDPLTDELHLQAKKSAVGFQMEDSMEDLRRDWGDLEVFCIDSADAQEIDDGLSLEEVDERTFWVHIHIANPTAFFAPSSAIARYAAHRTASLYLPDAVYPILPKEITQPCFSLGNNRPCITFSAKTTLAGDILDTQISHGILRNVQFLTPEDVQRELYPDEVRQVQPMNLTVGGTMPSMPARRKIVPISSEQRRSLRRLREIGEARAQKRAREGALSGSFFRPFCEPEVHVGLNGIGQTGFHLHERTARRFEGDPIISIKTYLDSSDLDDSMLISRRLVEPLMTLAGEIGAMWCSKRNIPIPYKGYLHYSDPFESPEQFKQKYLDPYIARKEKVPIYMIRRYFAILGKSVSSVVPVRHSLLGIEAYSKVTSPLRRFTDMMAHWQIEAAIRYESRIGKSLIGSTDESYLAFSRPEAKLLIQGIIAGENAIQKAHDVACRHWTTQFLFRAFYYKEAPLPEFFNVVVVSKLAIIGFRVFMTEFQMNFVLAETKTTESEGGMTIGDVWEVKIEKVDCYSQHCHVEAIRLVKRPHLEMEPWM